MFAAAISEFNASDPIRPWSVQISDAQKLALDRLNRKKLDKSGFPKFTKASQVSIFMERFRLKLRAQPIDPDLDRRQRDWMFAVLDDIIQQSTARRILQLASTSVKGEKKKKKKKKKKNLST